jgi:hypothetical protein
VSGYADVVNARNNAGLKCDNYPKTGDNAYVSRYADVVNARNNAGLPN